MKKQRKYSEDISSYLLKTASLDCVNKPGVCVTLFFFRVSRRSLHKRGRKAATSHEPRITKDETLKGC